MRRLPGHAFGPGRIIFVLLLVVSAPPAWAEVPLFLCPIYLSSAGSVSERLSEAYFKTLEQLRSAIGEEAFALHLEKTLASNSDFYRAPIGGELHPASKLIAQIGEATRRNEFPGADKLDLVEHHEGIRKRLKELQAQTVQAKRNVQESVERRRNVRISKRVLKGHKGSVHSANFSLDGKQVVTASSDLTAIVWDAATGKQNVVLKGHTNRIQSANFSRDGKQVVTASDDETAILWDAATGEQNVVLKGHTDRVPSAHFSPDGNQVVTASYDKTAILWDAVTGEQKAVFNGHTALLLSANFSPDGKWVVTASQDRTAIIWDAVTGERKTVLNWHTNWVRSANFSPDGKQVVTASHDNTVILWDLEFILEGEI